MEKNLKLSSKVIQAPEISNPRPWLPWVGVSCSNQSHRTKKEPTSWFGVQLEGGPRDVDSPPTGTNRELRTREQEAQSEVGKVRGSEWGCGLCVQMPTLQGHGIDGHIHQRPQHSVT